LSDSSPQDVPDEILHRYPCLEAEDISEALSYAAWRAQEIEVRLGRDL
jgi:uncharacterized protein (DUF433 family)